MRPAPSDSGLLDRADIVDGVGKRLSKSSSRVCLQRGPRPEQDDMENHRPRPPRGACLGRWRALRRWSLCRSPGSLSVRSSVSPDDSGGRLPRIRPTMLPHETLLSAGLVALTLLFLECLARGSRCSPPGRQSRPREATGSSAMASRAASGDSQSLPRWNHFISASGWRSCKRRNVGRRSSRSAARNEVGSPPARIVQYAESWWHGLLQSKSLEFFDERRAFDVQKLRGAISIPAGSIQAALNQVALDCLEIRGKVESLRQEDPRMVPELTRSAPWISAGRSDSSICSRPALSATARSTAFSSCLTLPGQE